MSGVDGNQSGRQPHSSGRSLNEPVRGALADGREILFFSTESASRPGTDHRDLRPGPRTRRMRFVATPAPVSGDDRPGPPGTYLQATATDVSAVPRPDGRSSEIPADDYEVVVFENRFPSLSTRGRAVDSGCPTATMTRSWPLPDTVAARSSASPVTTRLIRDVERRPRSARHRRVVAAHHRPVVARRDRGSVLLREPWRGDRGDVVASARTDLCLSVHHPADGVVEPRCAMPSGRDRP